MLTATSLNRSIGLALSALKNAKRNNEANKIALLTETVCNLNKAKIALKKEHYTMAILLTRIAFNNVKRAKSL